MVYYHLHLYIPNVLEARAARGLGSGYSFGDDFYPVWLAARQWRTEHVDLYSRDMTREIQIGLFGRALDARNPADPPVGYREFAYPAFTELIFWPVANADFTTLRTVLAVILPGLTAVSLWLWVLALQWRVHPLWFGILVLLALSSYQALEALFAEQPGLFAGFLLAGAILALCRQRLLLAGTLLSLTLIKPQMTLLAILFLLLWSLSDRRRVRFLAGFLITTLLLMAASLWIWPHWVGQWIGVLLGYDRYASPPLVRLLAGPMLGAYIGPAATIGLLALGAVASWRNRRASAGSPQFWLTFCLLLAITSVTLLPGQAVYDHVILIPAILLVLRYRHSLRAAGRVPRTLLMIGAAVLFWPWVAAFGVVVVRPLLTSAEFSAILSLPIRSVPSLPFAVLALLVYARRISPRSV